MAYTVENADSAWVRQNCGGVITDFAITLTSGAASGNYSPINDEDCTYAIFAENSCATVVATCECDVPYCELSAERVVNGTTGLFESVRLRWRYRSLPPSTPLLGNPIVSADLNGLDVLGAPYEDTGDEFVLEPVDLDASYTLTITNDCGEEVTCTVAIPCCWRQSLLRVTISGLTDVSSSCSDSTVTFVPRILGGSARYFHAEHEFNSSGLASLNGTTLFNLRKFDCALDDTPELLGTVTIYERNLVRYEFPFGSGTNYEMEQEREYDVDVYMLGTVLSFKVPSGEVTINERFDEFPAANRSGQYCIAGGVPACAEYVNQKLETMWTDEGIAPCGIVALQDFTIRHINGVEPTFNSTEASAHRPPVDLNGRVWCYAGGTPFGNKDTEFSGAVETEYQ